MSQIIVTNRGNEVLNNVLLTGEKIKFNKAVISDFDYGNADLSQLTSIEGARQETLVNTVNENEKIYIIAPFSNKTVADGYTAKLIAFYIEYNGEEILYGTHRLNEFVNAYSGEEVITTYTVDTTIDGAYVYLQIASDVETSQKVLELTEEISGLKAEVEVLANKPNIDMYSFTIPYTDQFIGWEYGTDTTYQTYYGSAVVDGDNIYVFGGDRGSITTIYNTVYNTSTLGASAKVNTFGSSAAKVGDDVYVFGGTYGTANYYQVYNIPSNSWSKSQTKLDCLGVNEEITDSCCAYDELKNAIYIFGSYNDPQNKTIKFDVATKKTEFVEPSPCSTTASSCVKVGRYIYVFGGGKKGSISGDNISENNHQVQRYDIDNNKWEILNAAPKNIQYSNSVYNENDNLIYVFGGDDSANYGHKYVQVYNVETGEWRYGVDPYKSLRACVAAIKDDRAYVFSGNEGKQNYVQIYRLISIADDRGVKYKIGDFKKGDTIYCSKSFYDEDENLYKEGVEHTLTKDRSIKTFITVPSKAINAGWVKRA